MSQWLQISLCTDHLYYPLPAHSSKICSKRDPSWPHPLRVSEGMCSHSTCNTPSSSPLGGNENCPAAPRLVLLSSLTYTEAVCTLGWSGGYACGPQPQLFFRVREHHKDCVSDTVLLVARLKMKLLLWEWHRSFACAVGRGSGCFKTAETTTSNRHTTSYV
jgi:hypothetical protein